MPEPASVPRRGRGRPGYDQATVPRRAIDLFNRLVNSLVEWFRPDGEMTVSAVADAITAIAFDGLDARPALRWSASAS